MDPSAKWTLSSGLVAEDLVFGETEEISPYHVAPPPLIRLSHPTVKQLLQESRKEIIETAPDLPKTNDDLVKLLEPCLEVSKGVGA